MSANKVSSGSATVPPAPARRRVVIADDERTIRMALRNVVRALGCDCVGEAVNGREAMEVYRKEKPDLLLMDINMPEMNGNEALAVIIREFPAAKVVVMTSVSEMNIVRDCIKLGAINYILKSNPLDKIKGMIAETLERI